MPYTRRLKTILQSKYLLKIIAVFFVISDFIFLNTYTYTSSYDKTTTEFIGTITSITKDSDKVTIYLKAKETLLVKYYYSDEEVESINRWSLGDTLKITGMLEEVSNNTIPNLFNYKKYLYYNKIYYLLDADKIEKIKNNESVLYYLKNKIGKRIDNMGSSSAYLKTFILGDKSNLDEEILASYQNNGVSHLFSISGMHVSLFAGIILFFLKKISYNDKYNYSVVVIFLLFYMFLVNYTASILRTFTMYLTSSINKCFNLKISNVNLALISLIILIIYNPRIIYNMGFQYSYLISLTLILFSKKINNKKHYLTKTFYISFISFLVSIPICIYNFYQINVISIILNIIFVPLVSVIIFPLSLITFIFPFLDKLLYFFIRIIEVISLLTSKINLTTITLAKINLSLILLYYVFIYLSLFKTRYFLVLVLALLIHTNISYFNSYFTITVLDVGQGDSIFIRFPYNKGNILIDTGGYTYETTYSIAEEKIIPYLKSIGVKKIDYLIESHGDADHIGEATNLIENFKVDKVIINQGDYADLEKELIGVLEDKNIKYYQGLKEINIDKYKLSFLNTGLYDNENDNSNVIYLNYNGIKFLFMGDASLEREKDILKKYNLNNIDFLKVGHHGSNTSSSEEFINSINPKYSIISVGKNNRYGHPKDSVLETLSNSIIYRTDYEGSIKIKITKNEYKISTCSP
jgi:competence protein ComEC